MFGKKLGKLISIAVVIAVFSALQPGVYAKSENSSDKKPVMSNSQGVSITEPEAKATADTKSEIKTADAKSEVKTSVSTKTEVKTTVGTKTEIKTTVNKNTPQPAVKTTQKTVTPNTKAKKIAVNTGISKQLSELGKKLNAIETETNRLSVEIDLFVKAGTTGSAIVTSGTALSVTGTAITSGTAVSTSGSAVTTSGSAVTTSGSAVTTSGSAVTTSGSAVTTSGSAVTTSGSAVTTSGSAVTTSGSAVTTSGSAVTTSGSAIETAKNSIAFVNSTSGKLNALSNRLSAAEKSIKALSGKVDRTSKASYDSLINRVSSIRSKLIRELEILKTIKTKGN